jgi:hypothetical protein
MHEKLVEYNPEQAEVRCCIFLDIVDFDEAVYYIVLESSFRQVLVNDVF